MDKEVNSYKVEILCNSKWGTVQWKDVSIQDNIVLFYKNILTILLFYNRIFKFIVKSG